jgi:predicted signal transduction protein with EAL and GGDEF domain
MHINTHEVHVTVSVGACVYPDYAADAKHLLKRADVAMYAAKERRQEPV